MTEPPKPFPGFYGFPSFQPFVTPQGKNAVQPPRSRPFKLSSHHQPVKSERHTAFEPRLKAVESELGELRSEIGEVWKALQETSSTLANICGQLQSFIDRDSSPLEPSVPSKASPSTNDFDSWLKAEFPVNAEFPALPN
ncbi:hypothetical protein N7476_005107 [Penicillium atrosanguineum]|uniref:Uncharacterized protein n=1 Tax=Penicillium atrosanguineum TaxID=1132637 RepID=A0A9W9U7B5_9EURO|nr:hypothetical protein N7476_005107 [Penicillium atrosanguineum]